MASTDDGKHTQSDDSSSIKNQENVSARGGASRTNKQQVRHRASVACASCRDRRIRCVVPKGESECTQCKRAGTECIIKNDDERRRPISKAYMSSLSERIMLLESMLHERGVAPPAAVHPPKTRQEARSKSIQYEHQPRPEQTAVIQSEQQQQPQQLQLIEEFQQQQSFEQEALAEPPSPPFLAQLNAALSTDGSPSRDDTTPPNSAEVEHDDYTMHKDDSLIDPSLTNIGVVVGMPTESLDLGTGVTTTDQINRDLEILSQSLNSVQSHQNYQGQQGQDHHNTHHTQHDMQPPPIQQSHHNKDIAQENLATTFPSANFKETSPFRNLGPKKEDIVHRVLSTKGNLSFDQLSGRLRFFGPTANSHVYAEAADAVDSREPPEQVRRSERIIRSLTEATHDYLLDCFWEFYNDIIYVLDREAFELSRETQNPKFYTSFLHITVLAMGYRFADRSRNDIKKISLGNRESTLQREAKYMLDIELERPGGIPSVQALLLLGDLECGVGRDNTGWMYSGMANRLAFDIGLHLDYRNTDINEKEVNIRHMVMKAAIVIDKYWALFLGRPTSIKSQDVGMDLLTKRFSMLTSLPDAMQSSSISRPSKMSNEEIYEYLFELMELAGKIVESRDMHNLGGGYGNGNGQSSGNSFAAAMSFAAGGPGNNKANRSMGPNGSANDNSSVFGLNETEENAYLHVISLDRQLQNWYRRLPDHLTWKPANIKAAPMSFFLLHQQYHVSMILLHRPWAKYGSILSSDGSSTNSHPSPSSTNGGSGGIDTRRGSMNSNHMGPNPYGLGDPQCIVDDSRTALSRSICTQQAIRVARIFWQHRQRFDGRRICVTGIQHAGTASIALIAALAYQQSNDTDRRSYLGYLEILSYALTDMSHTYQPASRMDDLLKAVLEQLRNDVHGPDYVPQMPESSAISNCARPGSYRSEYSGWLGGFSSVGGSNGSNNGIDVYSVLPARRENPDSAEASQASKKRRPATSRRASEFARPPPPFVNQPDSGSASVAKSVLHRSSGHHISSNSIMSSFNGQGSFSLDFLNESAIDGDGLDDPRDTTSFLRSSIDDYVLVPPGTDSWAQPGHGHHHSQSHGAFDMPIADWIMSDSASGAMSLPEDRKDGNTARHQNAATGGGAKAKTSLDNLRPRDPGAQAEGAAGDDAKHIVDWIDPVVREGHRHVDNDGRPLSALSPVNMSGLIVQTVEAENLSGKKVRRDSEDGQRSASSSRERKISDDRRAAKAAVSANSPAVAVQDDERNEELDFFRF